MINYCIFWFIGPLLKKIFENYIFIWFSAFSVCSRVFLILRRKRQIKERIIIQVALFIQLTNLQVNGITVFFSNKWCLLMAEIYLLWVSEAFLANIKCKLRSHKRCLPFWEQRHRYSNRSYECVGTGLDTSNVQKIK